MKDRKMMCPHEEMYLEHQIFIDENPDHYRGGFAWSVSKGDTELDCGLAVSIQDAQEEAYKAIVILSDK